MHVATAADLAVGSTIIFALKAPTFRAAMAASQPLAAGDAYRIRRPPVPSIPSL
jgi:hypothetical protein